MCEAVDGPPEIMDCRVPLSNADSSKNLGIAYVDVRRRAEAELFRNEIDGLELAGDGSRPLKVTIEGDDQDEHKRTVHVTGMRASDTLTKEKITESFEEPGGEVIDVRWTKGQPFCYVSFRSEDQAE